MDRRKVLLITVLLVLLLAILSFSLYPSLLTLSLGGTLPAGTIITWAGIIALPVLIYLVIKRLHRPVSGAFRFFRAFILVIIAFAMSWGGVAYYLAGNWAFNFSGSVSTFRGSAAASPYFWNYTYFLLALPIAFLLIYWSYLLVVYWQAYRAKKREK